MGFHNWRDYGYFAMLEEVHSVPVAVQLEFHKMMPVSLRGVDAEVVHTSQMEVLHMSQLEVLHNYDRDVSGNRE